MVFKRTIYPRDEEGKPKTFRQLVAEGRREGMEGEAERHIREDWKHRSKGAAPRIKVVGDPRLGYPYLPDAFRILAEAHDLMNLGHLPDRKLTRQLEDGTIITVTAGPQKSILIDPARPTDEEEVAPGAGVSCKITIGEIPSIIQPHMNPGKIDPTEVEGIDYIKVYYTVDDAECTNCSKIKWALCLLEPQCRPFYFRNDSIDHNEDPRDHCIISECNHCQAELIESGKDGGGTFIKFKAYTEWQCGFFNRSGLGYMLLEAYIEDGDGDRVCSDNVIIQVDCCEKVGLTQPEVFWEDWDAIDCSTSIIFSGTKLCKMGLTITWDQLISYANREAGGRAGRFYSLPDGGGCYPFNWGKDGPITIEQTDPLGRFVIVLPPTETPPCDVGSDLILGDRCGGEDEVHIKSCCEEHAAGSIVIGYTSLQMGCSVSQNLTVTGGCGPYSWSLSGGGTLVPSPETTLATYTSPGSNVDCAFNPTITVTDCCGKSASIQLAINCNTGALVAYVIFDWRDQGNDAGCVEPTRKRCDLYEKRYRCDGAFMGECLASTPCICANQQCGGQCPTLCVQGAAGSLCEAGFPFSCRDSSTFFNGCPSGGTENWPCQGEVRDRRTAAMKAAGCCPINPFTGLPF